MYIEDIKYICSGVEECSEIDNLDKIYLYVLAEFTSLCIENCDNGVYAVTSELVCLAGE